MANPNHNFRPNPERSVEVFDDFDDALIKSVVPTILKLRHASTLPITVYINSRGGLTRCLDTIQKVLQAPDPDGKRSRIITVAVGMAKSAAATLLSVGDYAIAYPDSVIHFHGIRLDGAEDVTMEKASSFATWLKERNDATAMRLADAFLGRLIMRFDLLKPQFEKIRKKQPKASDIRCFAHCLRVQVGDGIARTILGRALERYAAIRHLSNHVFTDSKILHMEGAAFEAGILKKVIEFEVESNKEPNWRLDADGLARVIEDYTLLRDYAVGDYLRYIEQIGRKYMGSLFPVADVTEWNEKVSKQGPEKQAEWLEDRSFEYVRPFVYFSVSLCRYLHERENALAPGEAYWLGVVDEVYGSNLPCLRELVEAQHDPTPPLPLKEG